MSRAQQFIQLQQKANQEIDEQGQTSIETFTELETLADSLTLAEIEEVLTHIRTKREACTQ
jgi:translation initiation factor 2B subunit (eIF-2B alpha/beta/delta family)